MASITTNLHVRDEDEIRAESRDGTRWLRIGKPGETGLAIFASDAQMSALRDTIDRYLGERDSGYLHLGKAGAAIERLKDERAAATTEAAQ